MSKLLPISKNDVIVGYMFDCPGCKCSHAPIVRPHKAENGASWAWNGDMEKPTFSPSIMSRVERSDGKTMICHSFVTNGRIRYLSDCTHELAGLEVELPDDTLCRD